MTAASGRHPHLTYRPDIDGLRAVAVLAVVAFHARANLAPGGFAGVDVFFVISGFLISSLIFEGLSRGTFSAMEFYARRIRRLMPSLILVLAASGAAGWVWLRDDELAQLGAHIASSAAFITNFALWNEAGYFDTVATQKPLLHLWSLGVEEQFYIVWPALVYLCWRRLPVIYGIVTVAVASFVLNIATVGDYPSTVFYWPTSRFWELAMGGGLAYAALADGSRPAITLPRFLAWLRPPAGPLAQNAYATGGLLLLAGGLSALDGESTFPGWWALLPTGGAFLLIAAGPPAWINRAILSHRILVWVGLISYPLYLWHWPLLTFLRLRLGGDLSWPVTALAVSAAFILADLSYRLVERPLRNASSGWLPVPALLLSAVAVVGALGQYVHVQGAELPSRFSPSVNALVKYGYRYSEPYRERTCYLMPDQPPAALAPECIETTPAEGPLLVLWGDSHAAHLYSGLKRLQQTMPFRIAEITGSRCPPLLDIETPTQPFCQDVNRMVLEKIGEWNPDTVLLSARWRLCDLSFLEGTIDAVRERAASRILLAGQVPHWDYRLPRILFNYVRQNPWEGVPRRTTFGLVDYLGEFEAEVRERAESLDVEYVSTIDAMCDADGCLTRVGDQPDALTAWDEAHLTATGSEYLIASIAGRLFRPAPAR